MILRCGYGAWREAVVRRPLGVFSSIHSGQEAEEKGSDPYALRMGKVASSAGEGAYASGARIVEL